MEASAKFHQGSLQAVEDLLARSDTQALAIVFASVGSDHDDWRRTLARDLARAHAPKRVNVVSADDPVKKGEMLAYLRDAPGVTGQYLQTHE